MNKEQKAILQDAENAVDEKVSALGDVLDELQEKFDGMSEKTQEGEKGEALQAEIDDLEEVISNLENASGGINGLCS